MEHDKVKLRFSYFRNILYIVVFLLLPNACSSLLETDVPIVSTKTVAPTQTLHFARETTIAEDECIDSFDFFAYVVPDEGEEISAIPPLAPWQIEATVPSPTEEDAKHIALIRVKIARFVDGQMEIWVERQIRIGTETDPNKERYELLIFMPESKEWKIISGEIENTGVYVDRLFIAPDGSIWGRNMYYPFTEIDLDQVPVLSKYNKKLERFELIQETPIIPVIRDANIISSPHEVLMDPQGKFWIFVQMDGLYSYDPATKETRQEAKIPDYFVQEVALAPDGSIYILRYFGYMYFDLQEGEILHFIPETGLISLIEIPTERWPSNSEIFVDQTGRLWLDSIGWREPDGVWHLMHPDVEGYFNNIGNIQALGPEQIFLESSNGVLWYRNFPERGGNPGIAWFDPQTGEGCWFTTEYTDIIEDPEGNLWIVVDGKLYKYDLYP